MKATVEKPDPLHCAISIELPWALISEELDREYNDLAKKVTIKGFRKGKIPRSVMRRRFGPKVMPEVLARLIQEAYEAALIQNRIRPVAAPELERGEIKDGEPYTFVARVEVQPEIELCKLDGFDVSIDRPEATDEMLEQEIERLRDSRAVLVPIGGRDQARPGDTAIVDYKASRDGTVLQGGEKADHEVELGAGNTVPGFAEAIVDMSVGQRKEFDLTFPEEGFPQEVAGKDVHFEIALKALKIKEIPELDDEFAEDLGEEGVETAADVRTMVGRRLREGLQAKAERDARTKLVEHLLEANPFPVPPALVERQKVAMLQEVQAMLQFRGLNPDQISANAGKMLEDIAPRAEREVASALLLIAVADQEKIEITDEEVQEHIQKVAAKSGENPARLRALFNDPKRLQELKINLRRDKVVDHLMKLSNIASSEGAVEPENGKDGQTPGITSPSGESK